MSTTKVLGGPSSSAVANGVATDSAGKVFLTGGLTGTVDFGNGVPTTTTANGGLFVAAYDAAGTNLWVKAYGQSGDAGMAIAVDGSNNLAITGHASGPIDFINTALPTSAEGWIVANFTTSGDFRWAKRNSASVGSGSSGYSLAYDANNHLYVAGQCPQNNSTLFDFDYGGGTILSTTGNPDGFLFEYTK